MRRVILVDTLATLKRDPTSYGNQWFLDSLDTAAFDLNDDCSAFENKTVKVTIELEEKTKP